MVMIAYSMSSQASEDDDDDDRSGIETIGQAYEWLRARALPKGVALLTEHGMKTSTVQERESGGLGGVRRAVYALLPAAQRRRLFFEMASSKEGLVRLRTCFGAPPYAFLHPSDIHMLNAGALGLRRTHLAYEYGSPIAPFGQVGAVVEDDAGNGYELVPHPRKSSDADPLPLVDAVRQGTMPHLALQISLKQDGLLPNPQRELELRETSYHRKLRGQPLRTTLRVRILSTHTSGSRRRTAVLNTRLLSASVDEPPTDGPSKKRRRPEAADVGTSATPSKPTPRLEDDVPPVPEFVQVG